MIEAWPLKKSPAAPGFFYLWSLRFALCREDRARRTEETNSRAARIFTNAMQLAGLKKSAPAKAKAMHVLNRSRIGNSSHDSVHTF
ncbi:MAG: hypothetical protein ABSG20_03730 [Bradyrhizobium sp.]|jgi:hypothetical protein